MSSSGGEKVVRESESRFSYALNGSSPQKVRNFTNRFQAFNESVGFGTFGLPDAIKFFADNSGWSLLQYIPSFVFNILALPYAFNEIVDGAAIARGAQNPDRFGGRSFSFPNDGIQEQLTVSAATTRSGVFPYPYAYTAKEQWYRGVLQAITASLIAEGAAEGLIQYAYPDFTGTLAFNLPWRMCIHFMGKALLDLHDAVKLYQEFAKNISDKQILYQSIYTIAFNFLTNALAATAFCLLACNNPLGFVFLAGFALARLWQNKHRPIFIWRDAPKDDFVPSDTESRPSSNPGAAAAK